MPTLNLAYIAELALRYLRKFAYLAFLIPFYIAVTAMWSAAVTAFLYYYHHIQTLLNTISQGPSGGSGDLLDKFFGLLNCIGFTDAYVDSSAAIVSGLIFLLGAILFKLTLVTTNYYIKSIQPFVN